MKKLLTLAALVGAASLSFGQGYVNFANTSTSRVSTNGTVVGLTSGAIGSWYYALLTAPSTQNSVDASLSGWTFGAYGTNTAGVGRMTGNTTTDGAGGSVAGTTPSSTADYVIVGWSANLGTDWQAVFSGRPTSLVPNTGGQIGSATWAGASSGWYGISVVSQDLPSAPATGPFNPVWGASGVPNLTLSLYVVPEPTSFALLGLGGAALMIFRRRK